MPSLNRTTIMRALGAGDTTVTFASSSTLRAGDVAYIDREAMTLQRAVTTTIWKVMRGTHGTSAAAHAVNNQVYTGRAGDFAVVSPQGFVLPGTSIQPLINIRTGDQFVVSTGGSWQKIGDDGVPAQIALASGSVAEHTTAGAITIQNGTTVINSATARAMTLAAPTQADDGTVMTILGMGGGAHTVTAAGGFNGAGTAYDVATFAATGGALTIQCISGVWRVVSLAGVTIA